MKYLLAFLLSCLFFQSLHAQTQPLVQPAIKINGKVSHRYLEPGRHYVYLYANYKGFALDSTLVLPDSTFSFTLPNTDTLFIYKIICLNYDAKGLFPKKKTVEINISFTPDEAQHDYQIEPSKSILWDDLIDLANWPLNLVERKNLSIIDSAEFLLQLNQVKDSALIVLQLYKDSMKEGAFKEYKRWLLMNTEIAKLDFFLLKRFHQKEKIFNAVPTNCVQISHQLLADSTKLYFTEVAYIKLKKRVAAIEKINFQTARYNPFEGDCQGIETKDLKYHEIFSDGLSCMYGVKGAIDLYQRDQNYLMGWAIPPQFEQILPYNNQLAIIKQGGKFGLMNGCGQIMVEPIYKKLTIGDWKKHDSMPLYYYFIKEKNIGVMDQNGKVILTDNYEWVTPLNKNHFTFYLPNDNKVGLIDNAGKVIVEPKYDRIEALHGVEGYYQVSYLHPFLRLYSLNCPSCALPSNGLIDAKGRELIKPGRYEFKSTTSGVIHWESFKYEFLKLNKHTTGRGYFFPEKGLQMPPQKGIYYNVINKGSYYTVKEKSQQYLFFPKRDSINKVKYDLLDLKNEGRGIVKIGDNIYLIDEHGDFERYGSFDEITAFFFMARETIAEVIKDEKWGLFSFEKFEFLANCEWDDIHKYDDVFYLKKNGRWTILPYTLKANNELFFDTIYKFNRDYFLGSRNGSQLILNEEGNIVLECQADAVYKMQKGFILEGTFTIEKDNRLFKVNGTKIEPFQLGEIQVVHLMAAGVITQVLVDKNGYILYKHKSDHSLNWIKVSDSGLWFVKKNGNELIFDEHGIEKTPFWCKYVTPYYLYEGVFYSSLPSAKNDIKGPASPMFFTVSTNNHAQGLLDHEFRLVLDTLYTDIRFFDSLIVLTQRRGLLIKDRYLNDILFVSKAKRLITLSDNKVVLEFPGGRVGLFDLKGKVVIKPRFKAIRILPNGLIMASRTKDYNVGRDFVLHHANGIRCSSAFYNLYEEFNTDLLGMINLTTTDQQAHIINKQGKLLLSTYPNEASFVRIPNFTSYFSMEDTLSYPFKRDTTNGIQVSMFLKEDRYRGLIVTDNNIMEQDRHLMNQVNMLYMETLLDIIELNPMLNKYRIQIYDVSKRTNLTQNLAFYFDRDSIYRVSSKDLLLDSMQLKFALSFIAQISSDKDIDWNACTSQNMLFNYIKLETDFSEKGLTFTSKSFKDLDGFTSERSVFYTWQELAPYLNKNHVLVKRFLGSTQYKN